MRRVAHSIAVVAALLALALGLGACGGEDGETDAGPAGTTAAPTEPPATTTAPEAAPPPAPEPPAPPPQPLPGLPEDTAGFEGWERLNARPIPEDSPQSRRVGFDAHRSVKNVYVNQPRGRLTRADGSQRLPYPYGTVLVKAGRTGGAITLVAVMRKIQGVDAQHGDWEWIEWKRDGPGERFETSPSLMGATCWGCHATAVDTDWVFTPLD